MHRSTPGFATTGSKPATRTLMGARLPRAWPALLHGLLLGGTLLGAMLLVGCAAPSTPSASGNLAGTEPVATAPPMSSPLPARELQPQPGPDTSCATNADCAVKDVGSCCGAMPACVNRDSAVDPAAVQARCQTEGRMGVCGFREISACQCDNGRCVDASPTPGRGVPLQESQP